MENKIRGRKSNGVKTLKRLFNLFVFRSIAFDVFIVLVGVFFLIKPYSGLRVCEIIFSIVLIIFGAAGVFDSSAKSIINMFKFNLIYGVLSMLLGFIILINPMALANILIICFGMWVTLSGALKIGYSISLKKYKEESWSVIFAIGLLTFLLGMLLIFNPFIELYITQVTSLFVILYAILDFTNNILFRKRTKEIIEIFR